MGAIHWGMAMSDRHNKNKRPFIVSVIPALFSWLALLGPHAYALAAFIFAFTALYLYERFSPDCADFPAWYLPLRGYLTTVVVICLSVAYLASIQ